MVKSFTDVLLVPFAKYLTKYGEWELSNVGGSILIPREKFHFDSILFKSKRLYYSADKSWRFIASVKIQDEDHFTRENVHHFQYLKGLECELTRKGVLRKKFYFRSSKIIIQLQERIKNLFIRDYLCNDLNFDLDLQKKISFIVPDNITILLFSQPIMAKDYETYSEEFELQFKQPKSIIWNIEIEKYLGAILSKGKYHKTLDSIIESLDIISKYLRKISRNRLEN
jgi:hypothetical protein